MISEYNSYKWAIAAIAEKLKIWDEKLQNEKEQRLTDLMNE